MIRSVIALSVVLFVIPQALASPPKLVLQITVDGLRADLITRYRHHYGDGGFKFLLEDGVVFQNAHYQHANTETIVGHTTLATGATPAIHGMVGNVWYNRATGELGYNIEDANAPILATRANVSAGAQVDPAQLRAGSQGRSPAAIIVPTLGDTLDVHTAGKSKVFGISGKDRSAVAMAGKTGVAYWYSTDSGDFQTSAYYMKEYPEWVSAWNGERRAEAYAGALWELSKPKKDYVLGDQDDRDYEVDLKGYGKTFPHSFGPREHPLFFTRLLVSPVGDELLLDFGKQLIHEEQLGRDEVTDYLSISFSSVDAVSHFFGPSSLENEEVVARLDRTLAELFEFIDDSVGLEHTLIVFSADHGMPEMPEYLSELGYAAGRIYSDEVIAAAKEISEREFGSPDIIKDFFRPFLYLDLDELHSASVTSTEAAEVLAQSLSRIEGVGGAFAVEQLPAAADGAVAAVKNTIHPQRTGEVYIFQAPYWFMMDRGPIATMHGSPWRYDTHVPIIFAGYGLDGQTVNRRVHPVDVAPTIAASIAISPPAGSVGTVLPEVVDQL